MFCENVALEFLFLTDNTDFTYNQTLFFCVYFESISALYVEKSI